MKRLGLLALAMVLAAPAAQACLLPSGLMISAPGFTVAAEPDPAPIAIGRHFSLTLTLCADVTPGRIVGIDAQMPAHRHGMNYKPVLTDLGAGRMRADGLMLHMPGLWRLTVEIEVGGKRHYLGYDLTLE